MPDIFRLTLTPRNGFYFGGEQAPDRTDYFLKSYTFPQQTTLLGMLRYELLKAAGLLTEVADKGYKITDEKEAADLIGPQSFDGSPAQDLGIFLRLSPLFVTYDDRPFFLTRNLEGMTLAQTPAKLTSAFGAEKSFIHYLDGFDAKEAYPYEQFANNTHEPIPVWKENRTNQDPWIFQKDIRIGITKQYKQQPKEEGFYKYETIYLHPRAAFVAYVEWKKAPPGFDDGAVRWVFLGGKRSPFRMEISDVGTDFFPEIAAAPHNQPSLLLSDAYVEANPAETCHLSLSYSRHFRNMKRLTKSAEVHHRKPVGDAAHPAKVLLARGSCFFTEDPSDLQNMLKQPAFHRIGYNYHTTR